MQNRAHDIENIQDEPSEVIECKLMMCPNCKQEVPETIYCLRCGFPIYAMKQLQQNKAEYLPSSNEETQSMPEEEIPESDTIEPEPVIHEESEVECIPDIQEQTVEPEMLPIPEPELLTAPEEQILLPEQSMEVQDKIILVEKPVIIEDVEILVDDNPEIEEEPVEGNPEPSQVYFNEPIADETVGEESEEMHGDYMPEPATQELLKDLMNSVSLKLWAIDLLTKERAKEDHFMKLYNGYRGRYEHCMSQRNKMLEKALDLEPLEKELDNARVGLGELDIRKSLGDLRKGEYDAKAPAYNWDIQYYEYEIADKKGEISYLENPAKLIPSQELVKLQELAQRNYESIEKLEADGKISVETAEIVRNDLQKDIGFLRELEGY